MVYPAAPSLSVGDEFPIPRSPAVVVPLVLRAFAPCWFPTIFIIVLVLGLLWVLSDSFLHPFGLCELAFALCGHMNACLSGARRCLVGGCEHCSMCVASVICYPAVCGLRRQLFVFLREDPCGELMALRYVKATGSPRRLR